MFMLFSCTSVNEPITGLYTSQVSIEYHSGNKVEDTSFQTVLIVNKDFEHYGAYKIKWLLDRYIYLGKQKVLLPNELVVAEHINVFSDKNDRTLPLILPYGILRDYHGQAADNRVLLSFEIKGQGIKVEVVACR